MIPKKISFLIASSFFVARLSNQTLGNQGVVNQTPKGIGEWKKPGTSENRSSSLFPTVNVNRKGHGIALKDM